MARVTPRQRWYKNEKVRKLNALLEGKEYEIRPFPVHVHYNGGYRNRNPADDAGRTGTTKRGKPKWERK